MAGILLISSSYKPDVGGIETYLQDLTFPKVNMRTFEATGCGSFLLTDYAHGMEKLFKIGEELTIYMDDNELVKLAKHYLKAEYEREAIGKRSRERAYVRKASN
jgi:spore maturation protein CgeB